MLCRLLYKIKQTMTLAILNTSPTPSPPYHVKDWLHQHWTMNDPEPFRPHFQKEIPRTNVMAVQHQMCLDNIGTDLVARCKVQNSTYHPWKDFPLHYIIAVSNSEYFRSITSLQDNARRHLGENNMARDQEPRVVNVPEDIPAEVFPTIREHMYTGKGIEQRLSLPITLN